jgi:hypothetical protein
MKGLEPTPRASGAPPVDAVIRRALATAPRDRYASAREMQGALVAALSSCDLSACSAAGAAIHDEVTTVAERAHVHPAAVAAGGHDARR